MSKDRDAEFVAFVQQVAPRLLTAAWLLTGEPAAAERMVREALERVYARWRRIKPEARPSAARREVMRRHTDLWRRRLEGPVELLTEPSDLREPREPRHAELVRALQTLPPRQREVVVLAHYLDLSEPETADILRVGLGRVEEASSQGLARLCALMDSRSVSAPSDQFVLAAVDRAAADPPLLHVGVEAILSGGKRRVRHRRAAGAGMAVGAVALVTTLSLVSGPEADVPPVDDATAEAIAWDESVDFQATFDEMEGASQDFQGARIARAPGDEHFTISVRSGGGRVEVERVDVDLPGQVELFRNGDNALVVTPEELPGRPMLHLVPTERTSGWTDTSATDGGTRVQAWWVRGVPRPKDLLDVYWSTDEEMVAASGTRVINAAVVADGFETRVAIVPGQDVWAELRQPLLGVVPIGQVAYGADPAGGVVAVLPQGAHDAEAHVSADVWGTDGSYDSDDVQVQLRTQEVDGYVVGAAALSESDFTREVIQIGAVGLSWIDGSGNSQPVDLLDSLSAEATARPDGRVQVAFDAIGEEVVVDPWRAGVATAEGPDGGLVLVTPAPEGIDETDDALAIFRTREGVSAAQGWSLSGAVGDVQPPLRWVVAGLDRWAPDQVAVDDRTDGEPLPTVLFATTTGPRWAGGDAPAPVEATDDELAWSIEEGLGLWAVQCLGPSGSAAGHPVVGELDTPALQLATCLDFPQPNQIGYVVAVLPADEARQAALLAADHTEAGPEPAELGTAHVVDIGQGRSLWAVRVSAGDRPTLDLASEIEGLDVDGAADVIWP